MLERTKEVNVVLSRNSHGAFEENHEKSQYHLPWRRRFL
jgi:hypothetical protein